MFQDLWDRQNRWDVVSSVHLYLADKNSKEDLHMYKRISPHNGSQCVLRIVRALYAVQLWFYSYPQGTHDLVGWCDECTQN